MLSDGFTSECNGATFGAKMPRVPSNFIESLRYYLPPIMEQQAIIAYLDEKTSRIDRIIKSREEKIKLLEELKTSIISNAVTKGIKKGVEMKDSGIDWIGKIPKHWDICPLKRCLTLRNGQDYKHIETESGYPVYGSGGIFKHASKYLYDGESVLFGRKGTIDKPLFVSGKFWTVDTMFYSIPLRDINCKYMYYQGLTIPFDRYATATALPSMTQTDLGNHLVCRPSLEEQNEIVNYIDIRLERIRNNKKKILHEISLLKEYRASLITEVVTGKRMVI